MTKLENITNNFKQPKTLQLIRLENLIEFCCLRCGKIKKSKLYAICDDEKDKKICNACYGYLLTNKKETE